MTQAASRHRAPGAATSTPRAPSSAPTSGTYPTLQADDAPLESGVYAVHDAAQSPPPAPRLRPTLRRAIQRLREDLCRRRQGLPAVAPAPARPSPPQSASPAAALVPAPTPRSDSRPQHSLEMRTYLDERGGSNFFVGEDGQGVFVATKAGPAVGTPVRVLIETCTGDSLTAEGRVVFCRSEGVRGVGVELALDAPLVRALRHFMDVRAPLVITGYAA